jgi:hypothetical protein
MVCCLPFGFAAAAGAAGLSAVLVPLRPWMPAISGALLIVGLVQLYRRQGTCQRRSRLSMAIFWVCAVLVLSMVLMPQVVASLLADRLPSVLFSFAAPAGQPHSALFSASQRLCGEVAATECGAALDPRAPFQDRRTRSELRPQSKAADGRR